MFDGVLWSQSDTLARAIEAIERCGLSVELGPRWFDVDGPGDLDASESPRSAPLYRCVLKRFTSAERYRLIRSIC